MENQTERDDILFENLEKSKKKKKRRIIRTVLIIVGLIVLALIVTVSVLRKRVMERFASAAPEVLSYEAEIGTISTTVSGSGFLAAVDSESLTVPAGVEITEVLVNAGDTLRQGDAIASVKMASVMTALSDTQEELDDLDDQINSSGSDSVNNYVNSSVKGRVKRICAQPGDTVVDCMAENGALLYLSLDGCMAADIPAELPSGSAVTVRCSDGKEYPGTVESCKNAVSRVTLTDNGPLYGDEILVLDENGRELGNGTLFIHSPLSVTGYAGTVKAVYARENQQVYAYSTLFTLTDTQYSASYDALLASRRETEETLSELLALLRTGALCAPYDGTVGSVDFAEDGGSTSSYSAYGSSDTSETAVVTYFPDEKLSITISVDESDILSLKVGQSAEITVSSVSEDELFPGTVTEISKVAASSSGVTYYSAVVELEKQENMLQGMSADVDVRIEGVDNAVLIPVDALHQTSDSAYVYTSYDEETKQYGGMVTVVPGVANSRFVEISEGLQPGDTVYYTEKQSNPFFAMMGMQGYGGGSARPGGSYGGGSARPGNNARPGSVPGGAGGNRG